MLNGRTSICWQQPNGHFLNVSFWLVKPQFSLAKTSILIQKPMGFSPSTAPPQSVVVLRPRMKTLWMRSWRQVQQPLCDSLSLRVENRPSVLGIFIYVPWGGVGWAGLGWGSSVHVLAHSHDVTPRHVHLHVRTYTSCYVEDVSRHAGVGLGGVG